MSLRLVAAGVVIASACARSATVHHADGLLADLLVIATESAVDATIDRVSHERDDADEAPAASMGVAPIALDRDFVAFALDPARPQLARCGGPVTIAVCVAPAGEISWLDVPGPPDVQRCVASALQSVRFVATVRGGSFRYTIPAASR